MRFFILVTERTRPAFLVVETLFLVGLANSNLLFAFSVLGLNPFRPLGLLLGAVGVTESTGVAGPGRGLTSPSWFTISSVSSSSSSASAERGRGEELATGTGGVRPSGDNTYRLVIKI